MDRIPNPRYLYHVRGQPGMCILTERCLRSEDGDTLADLENETFAIYQMYGEDIVHLVGVHRPNDNNNSDDPLFSSNILNAPSMQTVSLPEWTPPSTFQAPQTPAVVNVPVYPPTLFIGALGFAPITVTTAVPSPTTTIIGTPASSPSVAHPSIPVPATGPGVGLGPGAGPSAHASSTDSSVSTSTSVLPVTTHNHNHVSSGQSLTVLAQPPVVPQPSHALQPVPVQGLPQPGPFTQPDQLVQNPLPSSRNLLRNMINSPSLLGRRNKRRNNQS